MGTCLEVGYHFTTQKVDIPCNIHFLSTNTPYDLSLFCYRKIDPHLHAFEGIDVVDVSEDDGATKQESQNVQSFWIPVNVLIKESNRVFREFRPYLPAYYAALKEVVTNAVPIFGEEVSTIPVTIYFTLGEDNFNVFATPPSERNDFTGSLPLSTDVNEVYKKFIESYTSNRRLHQFVQANLPEVPE